LLALLEPLALALLLEGDGRRVGRWRRGRRTDWGRRGRGRWRRWPWWRWRWLCWPWRRRRRRLWWWRQRQRWRNRWLGRGWGRRWGCNGRWRSWRPSRLRQLRPQLGLHRLHGGLALPVDAGAQGQQQQRMRRQRQGQRQAPAAGGRGVEVGWGCVHPARTSWARGGFQGVASCTASPMRATPARCKASMASITVS